MSSKVHQILCKSLQKNNITINPALETPSSFQV